MRFTFDPRKTAQAAAWLLQRHGGRLTRGRLLKLLYLADRQSLIDTGRPVTGDYMVSMDQGPVLSITYDLIKGKYDEPEARAVWARYVETVPHTMQVRATHSVPMPARERFVYDNLSRYEMKVLEQVDEVYGALAWKDLSALTHQLPEWQDPHGSSWPIDPEDILAAGGVSPERVMSIAQEAEESRRLRTLLGAV